MDTKLPGWGRPLLDKLTDISTKPVTTIINTHTHFDHVSGNVEFPDSVEVVAHENTAALMGEMRQPTGTIPPQPNVFKDNNGRALPGRTFKDRLVLGAGAERIELHYFGRAHTAGDAFVFFPALRVMHAGDAFPNKGIPINREFVDMVRKAKSSGRTIDDTANTWRMPQRFLDAGFTQPPPGTSGQGTQRLRMNIEIVWNELK